jgi:hypothetical protein
MYKNIIVIMTNYVHLLVYFLVTGTQILPLKWKIPSTESCASIANGG